MGRRSAVHVTHPSHPDPALRLSARLLARGLFLLAALSAAGCAQLPALTLDLPRLATPEPAPVVAGAPYEDVESSRARTAPPGTRFLQPGNAVDPDLLGVIGYALSLEGSRYRRGGESPSTGFDCSGFVRHIYAQMGLDLPHSSAEMAKVLPKVDLDEREVGDLVLFKINGQRFSHVGIYIGDDEFIHATSSKTRRVMVSQLNDPYWRKRFQGVRRPDWQMVAHNDVQGGHAKSWALNERR
jgi:cell wall-associated NlpC family hydrolase